MGKSGKVKVSVFLDPELARAVKVQAARQGVGVSELVGKMFICAHCGEPIEDDPVVGIKLSPGTFCVRFHGNRKACRAASGADLRSTKQNGRGEKK
jgi:hypothetical protein